MKNSSSGLSARLSPIPALLRRGFAGAATLLPGLALANPTGGQVVDGKVTITTPSSGSMVITEGSNSAIVNWQTFSIGGKEYVQFIQPNSNSVILNRVVGNSPSQIFGNLTSNGRVFLINPDGVLFGKGASVDVGALVASTVNISDADFKAGHYVFSGATAGTGVVNNGTITAHNGGFIVLNGDYVHNSGVVQAKLGEVVLASGSAMTLSMDKGGLIDYTVDKAALSSKAGVVNSGQLLADGGRVIMTAEVAHDLVGTAVNNTGLVRAQGISQHDGEIELTASGGNVVDSGTLDASSTTGDGGKIELHSDQNVALQDGAQIVASGTETGGAIHVVADGALRTRTGSLIDAHATKHGGRGGYLELSGHGKTTIRGNMDLGQGGTLTIDPTNLTIASGGGANSSGTLAATWFEQNIETLLKAGTNINLVATNSITMNTLADHVLDGTNNGNGGSLLLGIGTLNGGGPSNGGVYIQGTGGTISFQTPTDSIKVDGGLTLNAGANTGTINVGNLQGGGIFLTGKSGITTGTLKATLGSMSITGGNITTGSIDVSNSQLAQSALTINSTGNVTVNGGISVTGGGGSATFDNFSPPIQASAQITTSKAIKVSGDITVTGRAFTLSSGGSSIDSEGGGQLQLQGSKINLAGVSVSGVGTASFQATASQSITIGSAVNVTASRTNIRRSGGSTSIDLSGNASILLGAINGSGSSALSITTHGLTATGPNAGISVTGGTLNLNNGPSGVAISAHALTGGTSTGGSGAFYQHSYGGGRNLVTTDFGGAAVSIDRMGSGNTKVGGISVSGPAAALLLEGSGGVTTVNGNVSVQASGYTVSGSASEVPGFRGFGAPIRGIGSTFLLLRPPMLVDGTTHWGSAMFIAGGSSAAGGDAIDISGNVTVSGIGQAAVKISASALTVGRTMSVTAAKGSMQGVATTSYFNSSTQSFGSITRTISNSAGTGAATFGQAGVAINIGSATGDNVSIGSLSVRGLSAEASLQGGHNISIAGGVTVDGQFGGSAPDFKEIATVHPGSGGSSTGTTHWVGDNNYLEIGGQTNATGAVALGDVSVSGYGLVKLYVEGGTVSMGNVSVTQSTGLFTSTDKTRYSTSYSLTNPGTFILLEGTSGSAQANSVTVTSAGALTQHMSLDVANGYTVNAPSYSSVVSGIGSLPNPLLSAPSAPGNPVSVPADGTIQGVSVSAKDITLNISGNLALTTQSLMASHNLSIQTGGDLTLSSNTLAGNNSLSLNAGGNFSDTNSTLSGAAVTVAATGSLSLSGTTFLGASSSSRGAISLTSKTLLLTPGLSLAGTNVTIDVTGGDLDLTNSNVDASSALTLTASGSVQAANSVLLGDVTTINGKTGITLTDTTVAGSGGTTPSTSITMTSSNGVITGTNSTVVEGVDVTMTGLGFVGNASGSTPTISATNLTINATGSDLDITPAVNLVVSNDMLLESQTGAVKVSEDLTAGGNVTIQASNGLVNAQNVTAGGTVAITAGNGDVTTQALNAGTSVLISAAQGSVTTQAISAGGAAGGVVTITAGHAITTGDISGASGIDLAAGTTLTTGNDSATGNITLAAGTGITLTNDVLAAGGVLSLTAATGDISATNASLGGSGIVLLATTGSIGLNNSLLTASSIGAVAGTNINITHSALGGVATSPSAAVIALSANGGDITLDHATALTGDAIGLFATDSITSTNSAGETTVINAGALSAQAFNTIDLSQAVLEIGTGTAQFGGDSALLQQISEQSGGKLVLPSSGPNASFKAKVVNLGTIQTQTAGADLYLYIESLATTSGLGYSIASINGAGNALLNYNLYGGDVQVVNLPAGAKPLIGNLDSTTPTPLTINGTVNAPDGLTTLIIGSSLYAGDITVSPGTVFSPNDPAAVNLVLATTGTVSGADNLHTTGYVLLLNQVASTPITLPITPGDYAPPPTGGIGGPQPPPSDPDDPGVNDGNKGTIQQSSSPGGQTSCGAI